MLREISLSVALLFLTSGVLINAQKSASGKETVVSVGVGGPLTVECPLRVEQRAEWRLNGSAVPGDMRPAGEQPAGEGRLTARLHAAQARAHHAGVYTCGREPDAARVRVRLLAAAAPAVPAAAAAAAAPTRAAPAGEPEGGEPQREFPDSGATLVYYDINRNLSLRCPLAKSDASLAYQWKKNEVSVDEVAQLKERFVLEEEGALFKLKARAAEEDYGNYSCQLGAEQAAWDVRGRPLARLADNANVVENQNVKLHCKVIGKPAPRVWWSYNESLESNATALLAAGARGGRVALLPNEQGVPDAVLELRAAERADAGAYWCHAGERSADHVTLRVKDMYAALWPFLGICAEVFVLCAIILVYEKRRTKPELDDSDTDNHDQKKS